MNSTITPLSLSSATEPPSSAIDLRRLLIVLFVHKWKVIFWTLAGLLAAGYVVFTHARQYESEAKLLVRYVVDRSSDPKAETISYFKDNLVNTEIEIVGSWDLALKVAETLTPKRILPDSFSPTATEAAKEIIRNTTITPSRLSNVISVAYRDHDPELARLVLHELVTQYFAKHLEVHRSADTFDMVSQQTDQVRARLAQTEEELKRIKSKAGLISLVSTAASLDAQLMKSNTDAQTATTERIAQEAYVKELEKQLGESESKSKGETETKVSVEELQRFRTISDAVEGLRKKQLELLGKFTEDSKIVQLNREQLDSLEKQRHELLQATPGLAALTRAGVAWHPGETDYMGDKARLAGAEAKEKALIADHEAMKLQVEAFSEVATQIAQLERKKKMEEENYLYFESSLEKARVDEALDPTKMPNISVVQKPSPPIRVFGEIRKLLIVLIGGGLSLGLFAAFLSGVVFDRSIKRPYELEEILRVPLLLSIPYLGDPQRDRALRQRKLVPPAPREMQHYVEAIRDRLVLYFEINQMRHRPKLVGITGCAREAGVSTLAEGLANAMTASGIGRILLIDMDATADKRCRLFNGEPPCALSDVLPNNGTAELATTTALEELGSPLLPNVFYELVPSLRASDFEYIIFDMPPLNEGSAALALAGSMDHTIMVVEAEESESGFVKRAYRELTAAQAKVSAVLNKTRTYGPQWVALHS